MPDSPRNKKIKVKPNYTDEEVRDMGLKMAELERKREKKDDERKAKAKEFKGEIGKLDEEITTIAKKLNGEHYEWVDVTMRLAKKGTVREWVDGNGRVVESEPAEPGDAELFD